MKGRKVNTGYLNLYQEIPLFCALALRSFFRAKLREKTGRVLIVNTCLIGEFAASIPAIRDYLQRHEGVVIDLMVSPPLKPLAEKIRGVRRVYVATSLYRRENETGVDADQQFDSYDTIFVMRISRDAFLLIRNIAAGKIRTGLREYSGYALHLWGSLLTRTRPKQWRALNFEMLGGELKESSFDEIFEFSESELSEIAQRAELQTTQKKIIIHTGAGWIMKKWKNEKWIELLQRLHQLNDVRFIFVGGGEEDAADYTHISSKLAFQTYSLINNIGLLELLLVLHQGDYFIGTDSGPRNMAHLAGTPTVAIFGPGPHFYMPWRTTDVAIDKSRGRGLYQMFFYKKHGFIDDISVDEVYEAFKNTLWKS